MRASRRRSVPPAVVERTTSRTGSCRPATLAAVEGGQQEVRADRAALLERLRDRGEARVAGDLDVVVADDREVVRARRRRARRPPPARPSPACRRPRRSPSAGPASVQQLARQDRGRLAPVRGSSHELRVHLEPGRAERLLIADAPHGARGEPVVVVLEVAEEGDPLVAELEQVLGGQAAAGDVVGVHRRQALVRVVHEHHRHLGRGEAVEVGVRRAQRDGEQAVEPAGQRPERTPSPGPGARRRTAPCGSPRPPGRARRRGAARSPRAG